MSAVIQMHSALFYICKRSDWGVIFLMAFRVWRFHEKLSLRCIRSPDLSLFGLGSPLNTSSWCVWWLKSNKLRWTVLCAVALACLTFGGLPRVSNLTRGSARLWTVFRTKPKHDISGNKIRISDDTWVTGHIDLAGVWPNSFRRTHPWGLAFPSTWKTVT